ncbi:bestrophin family protein [Niabella beijingensis]|uniref:bestrophin family protein n=1 Tax=Niabella beijingensis TaxID=2872700 RepID=UPI001CBA97FE|nr:bestrophin family ion channel [Niabella beijingensis]MBZ4188426.1 hypothetical protein [Niabella beijingensis]
MLLKKHIPFRYIFGKIRYEIIGVSIYTIIVASLYGFYNLSHLTIPLTVPTIMITVTSLLLAFKSNQAYERWWEARTIWGAIVNDSRTMARQISNYVQDSIPGDEAYFFKQTFIKRQIAWCISLSNTLRGKDPLKGAEKYIVRKDAQHLKNFNNIPMGILQLHAHSLQEAYRKGWINTYQQMEMDGTLTRFSNEMGGCERIKKTVFPVTYSFYIHISLMFIFALMPFALLDIFGWLTIPMVIALAAVYFLIEKMAVHLQDPFENKPTDTPMSSICFTIERDLKQIMFEPHHQDTNGTAGMVYEHRYYVL